MATSNPSTFLAESFTALSKSVYQAFTAVENQSRADVADAVSDAREARHERDEAIKALQAYQLEGQGWKQEVGACQASLKQAEMTIAHQAETISQLRREATQWKDQSQNWQEHFLRVEQERCVLSTRLEELVSEQLTLNRPPATTAPFTPKPKYAHIIDSAPSSTATKRASTSSSNQPPAYKSVIPPSSPEPESPLERVRTQKNAHSGPKQLKPTKPNPMQRDSPLSQRPAAAQPSSSSKQNAHVKVIRVQKSTVRNPAQTQQPPSTNRMVRSEPRQTFIRRVQAVVHVPIKQEDTDEHSFEASVSDSGVGGVSMTRRKPIRRKSKVVQDEEEDSYAEEEIDGQQNGESRGSEGIMTPSDEEDEDEEDELMMGAEDNHHEVYGTERVISSSHLHGRNKITTTAPNSPSKKRKLVGGSEKPPIKRRC